MLELISPLSPGEGLGRLKANVDPQWKLFGSRPVLGNVLGDRFWGYRRIFYGNAFRTFVFARFVSDGPGSRIVLRFGISPFVVAFMTIWFGGLALIGGGMIIYATMAYLRGGARPETWIFIVGPLAMAVFGVGFIRFGRWLGRNEQAFLTEFLRRVLDASPVERAAS